MKLADKIRYSILVFFILLFSFFSMRHFILGGGAAASIDALCPFGGFETLFTFIATGNFVPRVLLSSLILGIGVLLTVIIFHKGFCGYICPFGAVQELLGKITKKKFEPAGTTDKSLRYMRYVILAVVLIGTAITGTLVFRGYDPFMTLFHFGKGIFWDYDSAEFAEHIIPFLLVIVILFSAVFVRRFWCRYLCPLVAVMNIFSFFSLTGIYREQGKKRKFCANCKQCEKKCPMSVKITKGTKIKDPECISCNQCVSVCPQNILNIRFLGIRMTPVFYAVVVVVLFFAVIGAAKAAGVWQSVPGIGLTDNQGTLSSDQIKGWMTLSDISDATGISVNQLVSDMQLPTDVDSRLPLKDFADTYNIEFETENVREYIDNLADAGFGTGTSQDTEVNSVTEQVVSSTEDKYPVTGNMSLVEVSQMTGICLGHLAREFSIPQNVDPYMPIKDISEYYNFDFSVHSLREFVNNFEHEEGEVQHSDNDQNINDTNQVLTIKPEDKDVLCPWDIREDSYPGLCGLYKDYDGNSICDLSE